MLEAAEVWNCFAIPLVQKGCVVGSSCNSIFDTGRGPFESTVLPSVSTMVVFRCTRWTRFGRGFRFFPLVANLLVLDGAEANARVAVKRTEVRRLWVIIFFIFFYGGVTE